MLKTTKSILLVMSIFALFLPLTGSADEQEERPFKANGQYTYVADLSVLPEVPWTIVEYIGEATHLGTFTGTGSGVTNLATGVASGSGYFTAANGDQLNWTFRGEGGYPNPVYYTVKGGTGRFENASGTLIQWPTLISMVPDGNLLKITDGYTFEGTITY